MLRNLSYLACLALLFCLVSCTQGDPDGPVPNGESQVDSGPDVGGMAPPEAAWTEEYERMVSVLGLSGQESQTLKAAYEARAETLTQWWTEKGSQFKQYQQEMMQAAKTRDLAGVRRAKEKVDPLRKELDALLEAQQSTIRNALSSDHLFKWDVRQVSERILDIMQPVNLSDQQKSRVQTEAGSAVHASVNEINPKAAAYMKLEQAVERSVLTAQQRQEFQDIKKKHPLRSLK